MGPDDLAGGGANDRIGGGQLQVGVLERGDRDSDDATECAHLLAGRSSAPAGTSPAAGSALLLPLRALPGARTRSAVSSSRSSSTSCRTRSSLSSVRWSCRASFVMS